MEQHLLIFGFINIAILCLSLLSLLIKARWLVMISRILSPYAGAVIASITASLVVRCLISPVQALREFLNPTTYLLASSFPLFIVLNPNLPILSTFQYMVIFVSMAASLHCKKPRLSLILSLTLSLPLHILVLIASIALISEV